MKFLDSTFALVILVAACAKSQYVPVPIDAPNRQKDHIQSKCLPMWNSVFVGTKGARTTIRTNFDARHTLVMTEGDKGWLIDGKGHNSSANPAISYVAICKAFGDQGELSGVEVQGFKKGQALFTITYVQNISVGDKTGNAFDYRDVDNTDTDVEGPDTYIALTK